MKCRHCGDETKCKGGLCEACKYPLEAAAKNRSSLCALYDGWDQRQLVGVHDGNEQAVRRDYHGRHTPIDV